MRTYSLEILMVYQPLASKCYTESLCFYDFQILLIVSVISHILFFYNIRLEFRVIIVPQENVFAF